MEHIVIWDGMEIIGLIAGAVILVVGFTAIGLWALARSIKRKIHLKKRRRGEK